MFMVYTPDHWCHVQELADLPPQVQHRLIRPRISNRYDSCYMYDIDYKNISKTLELPVNDTNLLPIKKCSNGWVYDEAYFKETAVTKVSWN